MTKMENMRTEDQARQSFCTQRLAEEAPPLTAAHCLGQQCMAWRWYDSVRELQALGADQRRGFCGLAGRP
jgi:hypothetical protein